MTRHRILILEDDPAIGALFGALLEEMGHVVCGIAATRATAIAAARATVPDLMLVDAWLGDESGVDTVDDIRKVKLIPHIFVTGDVSRVKGLRPAAMVLQKPFREADLARAIEKLMIVMIAQPSSAI